MQNKKPIIKIFAVAGFLVLSVFVVAAAAILSYNFATNNSEHAQRGQLGAGNNDTGENMADGGGGRHVLSDVNFLITGIDEHNLADIIFVVHFNAQRGTLDVVSIPRDTRVQFSQEQRQELMDRGVSNPATHLFRINELVNRSGGRNDNGFEYARMFIGDMLGIEIHYHVSMYLSGFRNIVDAVGGVYMDVPQRLFYDGRACIYTGDFFPNRIFIDLQPGRQLLNGRDAEAVVRFRNHPRGDFFRIELQQAFMREFFEQALTLEALVNNPLSLVMTLITHVNTNIGMATINGFLQGGMVATLNVDSASFHTAPVVRSGGDYLLELFSAQQLISNIVAGTLPDDEQ